MPRWAPNTQERLVQAALDLYTEQGYERTTVPEIADRVGVTSRTYFRHFPDKREVLFASGNAIREAIVAATTEALESQPPYEAVLTGVAAGRDVFQSREFAQRREAVIATSEELQERELIKLASISAALRTLLVDAGCDDATARMTADAGVAVFVEATRRWQAGDDGPFEELVDDAAQLLRRAATPLAARET
jgi:AcrR family transcriptional regulator